MAIYRLLQQSAFGPEDISRMTAAYEQCLRVLKLANRADPITELLAKYVTKSSKPGRAIRRISARSRSSVWAFDSTRSGKRGGLWPRRALD